MTSSLRPPVRLGPLLWFGALASLLLGIENLVIHQPVFSQRPALPVGVAFDLLVCLPLLFYFLVMRPYRLPLTSLVAVLGACLGLASWLLPAAQQAPLRALRLLPALLEAAALGLAATRARRLVHTYRAAYAREPHVWPSAQAAMRSLGAVGELLLAELTVLRYAGLGWWARPERPIRATAFSSYRESGFVALVATAAGVLVVEATCVHLLAQHWCPALAPWLLLADAYGLVFLLGHAQAVRLRPVLLSPDELRLRIGFVWELAVPRTALVAAEALHEAPAAGSGVLGLSKLLFASPNLLLTFAKPVVVVGPYGLRRTARRLAVYLDQPQQFIAASRLHS
ncbi:hypothetical protein GKZ68_15315 [Hymenobacter sp. BRD128]|uniref:hypothetical protein n=1 Tax=Hymenobacter sp. BRD128 TaxID=2675878 RepID=UPI0015677F28|nr:hypothetical protein [Hymenobacter sp. BRD128]QKG57874.1 hypothetical protein GKZ68_15315 [Hymenobacter sp. BRD128]